MAYLPPSVADLQIKATLQAVRKALPRAADVLSPENIVVRDFTAGKIDKNPYYKTSVVDGYQGGKDRFDQVLNQQADQTVRVVEKFATKADRDARLNILVNAAGKHDSDILHFEKKKEGSYRCDYVENRQVDNGDSWDSSYRAEVKGKAKIKVVDDTTLVTQDTKYCPRNDQEEYIPFNEEDEQILETIRPSSIENRLLNDEAVASMVDACKDTQLKELPPHTPNQLADAAELAVVQSQPGLVERLMTLTGKAPSLAQQNKLMSLATTKEDKQALKNIFMDDALDPTRGQLSGRALFKALTSMQSGGVPRGTDLATFLTNSAKFDRVPNRAQPSIDGTAKRQLEADVEPEVQNKKRCLEL